MAFLEERNHRHETVLECVRLDLALVPCQGALELVQLVQLGGEVDDDGGKFHFGVAVEAIEVENEQVG